MPPTKRSDTAPRSDRRQQLPDLFGTARRSCERAWWLIAAYGAHWRESALFDVARNAPTRQSSFLSPKLARRAGRPLRNGRFCATKVEDHPWWMVEFEQDWPIHAIRIHNRSDRNATKATHLVVAVSPDGKDWQVVHSGVHYFGDEAAPGPLEIRLLGKHRGRYVRLELPHKGALCLRLVEVLVKRKRRALPSTWSMPLKPLRVVRRRIAEGRHIPPWWRAWRNQVLAARTSPPLVNVAVHGTANQSSIADSDNKQGPMIGISGRFDGERFFKTEHQANPWWMVDLGIGWPVYAIRLHNRAGLESRLASRIMVSISTDRENWTNVLAGVHFFGDADAPGPLEIRLRSGTVARFVRLELPESGILSLRQVEVMVESRLIDLHTTCKRYGFEYPLMVPRRVGAPDRLAYTIDGAPQAFDGAIDAFHIERRIGRFGNHLKTLILATCLARRLGVNRIYLTKLSQFEIAEPLEADGITLLPERMLAGDKPGAVLGGAFYYQDAFGECIETIESQEMAWALRNLVRPLFWRAARTPPFAPADSDLAIHIRSGDLFSRQRPHSGYVQPPLAYYQLIVRYAQQELGIERVILVYEDEGNPCTGALKQWLQGIGMPFVAQSASLEEDLSVLLHARHCVFGHGSFGPAIIQLSNCMRTVFVFWTQTGTMEIARSVGVRPIFIRDVAGRYIKTGTWSASPEQRQTMLDYPIESIALDDNTPASLPESFDPSYVMLR
jgi:hypothetical protein